MIIQSPSKRIIFGKNQLPKVRMLDHLKRNRTETEEKQPVKKIGNVIRLKKNDLIDWQGPKEAVFKDGFRMFETQLLGKNEMPIENQIRQV